MRAELEQMESDLNIRLQSFARIGDLKEAENALLDRITRLHDDVQRIKQYIREMQVRGLRVGAGEGRCGVEEEAPVDRIMRLISLANDSLNPSPGPAPAIAATQGGVALPPGVPPD